MAVSFQVDHSKNPHLGGSSSEEHVAGDSRFGWFQKGVEVLHPSSKKTQKVRFLPARDNTLSVNDAAYATSVLPYRDKTSGRQDEDTKSPAFNAFFVVVVGYKFVGRMKASFLSPQTLGRLGALSADMRDPFQIMRRALDGNARWAGLKDAVIPNTDPKKESLIIPKARLSGVANALSFDDVTQVPKANVVVAYSYAAHKDLKEKLTAPRPAGQNPVGPGEWDDAFMYGDVTAPATGLVAYLMDTQLGTIRSPAFHFSQARHNLTGASAFNVDVNTPWGQQMLAGRYDLFSDKTFKIPSFQELVELAVEDGTIPYDFIAETLSGMCNIPPRPANAPTLLPTGAAPATAAPAGWGGPAPAAAAPAGWGTPAPAQPAAPGGWGTGQPAQPAAPAGWGGAAPAATAAPTGWGGTAPTQPAAPAAGTWPAPAATAAPAGWGGPAPTQPAATPPWGGGTTAAEDDVPYPAAGAPPAPPAPPEPPAPPAPPAPPPAPAEPSFWVHNNGVTQLLTRSATQEMVNAGFCGKAMTQDKLSGWKDVAELGFRLAAAAPAAPAAPASAPAAPASVPTAAPVTPPAPAAAAGPVRPPMPVAGGMATPPAPVPSQSKLTPEEATRMAFFVSEINQGRAAQFTAEQVDEYGRLITKAA